MPENLNNKFVSKELQSLIPVLAETMKFAVQAVKQSSAIGDLLISKGVVTREELDERMRTHPDLTKKLMNLLDESFRKHN